MKLHLINLLTNKQNGMCMYSAKPKIFRLLVMITLGFLGKKRSVRLCGVLFININKY